jgi:hypothetical protein
VAKAESVSSPGTCAPEPASMPAGESPARATFRLPGALDSPRNSAAPAAAGSFKE